MILPTINFIKTHPDAQLPFKKHRWDDVKKIQTGDAGFDLFSVVDIIIPPSTQKRGAESVDIGHVVVDVGIEVGYIAPGWWFRIEGRSGLGFKSGIFPHFGIIDNQYRGNLAVKLYNTTSSPYHVKKGDKIAQFVPYINQEFVVSFIDKTDVKETNRGSNGFGSTGK